MRVAPFPPGATRTFRTNRQPGAAPAAQPVSPARGRPRERRQPAYVSSRRAREPAEPSAGRAQATKPRSEKPTEPREERRPGCPSGALPSGARAGDCVLVMSAASVMVRRWLRRMMRVTGRLRLVGWRRRVDGRVLARRTLWWTARGTLVWRRTEVSSVARTVRPARLFAVAIRFGAKTHRTADGRWRTGRDRHR
jgi:hypothetical protein